MPDRTDSIANATRCTNEQDFYAAPGRHLIGTLCRPFLDEHALTPLELLHCPVHQNRLLDNGKVMQKAVRMIAAAQAKGTSETPEERAKQLHRFVDKIFVDTPIRAAKPKTPALKAKSLNPTLDAIKTQVEPDAFEFQVFRTLSDYLAELADWREKLTRFLDLFSEPPNPEYAAYLDALLAEMLVSALALDVVFGAADKLENRMLDLGALIGGRPSDTEGRNSAPIGMMIGAIFERFPMTASRSVIEAQLVDLLIKEATLADGSALSEARALSRLYKLMDGVDAGARAQTIIEVRMSELMSPERVAAILREQTSLNRKLRLLVALHDIMIGHQNRSSIVGKIKYLFEDFHFEPELLNGSDPIEVVRGIGRLHWAFRTSEISGRLERQMTERLADIQSRYLKQHGLFAKLNKQGRNPAERAIKLIDLCASHAFAEGENLDAARKLIGHYLCQSEFKPAFVEHVSAQPDPKARINDLKKQLKEIGVDPIVLG